MVSAPVADEGAYLLCSDDITILCRILWNLINIHSFKQTEK